MASNLLNCKTCNHQVARSAKTCPSCGEKLRMGSFAKFTLWLIATPFILAFMGGVVSGLSGGSASTSPAERKAQTAQEKRLQLAWSRVSAVKQLMRDPESFVLESVHVSSSDAVCVEYRARNGFGGMNRESVVIDGTTPYQSSDRSGEFPKMWNKLCAGQTTWDLTDRVKNSL